MADRHQQRPLRPPVEDSFLTAVADGLELDVKEAAVYLAALRSGGRSVQAIAVAAQTERTGTYDVLERLARRKYLRIDRVGKRGKVVIESPETLRTLLSAKLAAVEAMLPQLMQLYDQHADVFTVNRRVDTAALGLFLDSLRRGSPPYRLTLGSMSPLDMPDVDSDTINLMTDLLVEKRVKILVGSALSPAARTWTTALHSLLSCRRLPSSALVTSTQLVTAQMVVTLLAESDELVGIAVSSVALATHQRAMFDALWRTVKSVT